MAQRTVRRDSLKSNKNPNYCDEAQVAALVKEASSALFTAPGKN